MSGAQLWCSGTFPSFLPNIQCLSCKVPPHPPHTTSSTVPPAPWKSSCAGVREKKGSLTPKLAEDQINVKMTRQERSRKLSLYFQVLPQHSSERKTHTVVLKRALAGINRLRDKIVHTTSNERKWSTTWKEILSRHTAADARNVLRHHTPPPPPPSSSRGFLTFDRVWFLSHKRRIDVLSSHTSLCRWNTTLSDKSGRDAADDIPRMRHATCMKLHVWNCNVIVHCDVLYNKRPITVTQIECVQMIIVLFEKFSLRHFFSS